MKFSKMHGAGNDFIVIETNDEQRHWSQVALTTCDRHYGIGADGLLLIMPSSIADLRMRIFNADGSEARACGNGLRCVVKHVVDKGLVNPQVQEVSVETIAGVRKARVYRVAGKVTRVRAGMGEPGFTPKDIPMVAQGRSKVSLKSMSSYSITIEDRKLNLDLVSTGNPHAVYFCEEAVASFPLAEVGSKVGRPEIFPSGINFEIARVLSRQEIEARVWEDGVGETLACGSGACAITVAARLRGYIDDSVDIRLPGGILEVEWDGRGEVFLSGPAETVFSGEWLS